ncbi:hypothetical protein R1sor_003115 [Riccia sorocarpa]|uniref:Uncharacterized protein n=1 Tax=Riccia sorocarpa TaxID=122646 RepID=A0ABD3H129_9MARC
MVDGRDIPMNVNIIHIVFGLKEGRTAPRYARHYEDLSNWVLERSKTAKTWYANDVFLPEWRPIINVVLLGKQKSLEVTGAFIYILKNKVGPANLNKDLDWATYFKEKIREEIMACRKQMMAAGKRKIRPTCIGIVILHILRVLGVVGDEQLVHSDSEEGLLERQQSGSQDRHIQSSSSDAPNRDNSSSLASWRSGRLIHAAASSSEPSPGPDRRVALASSAIIYWLLRSEIQCSNLEAKSKWDSVFIEQILVAGCLERLGPESYWIMIAYDLMRSGLLVDFPRL